MKFRGKITDSNSIQRFTSIVGTMAKLAKSCILRITMDKLYFILSERVTNGGIRIWCEIPQQHFFDEYNMEGVTPEANEIYLEIVPENVSKALKSAQNARAMKIKLTKKYGTPCLTLEIELPTSTQSFRVVVQDVPIEVIARRHWTEHGEPDMVDFDVGIYMPSLKLLRNVVDRMKNLSGFVTVSANRRGELKLSIESDSATVSTHFTDLKHPTWSSMNGGTSEGGTDAVASGRDKHIDDAKFFAARIDVKKFAQFLSGHQHTPVQLICNISHDHTIHFLVLNDEVSLQYFMPNISL